MRFNSNIFNGFDAQVANLKQMFQKNLKNYFHLLLTKRTAASIPNKITHKSRLQIKRTGCCKLQLLEIKTTKL